MRYSKEEQVYGYDFDPNGLDNLEEGDQYDEYDDYELEQYKNKAKEQLCRHDLLGQY